MLTYADNTETFALEDAHRLLRRIGDGGSGGGSKLMLPRCVLGLDFICASLTLLAQVEARTKACRIRLTKPTN